MGTFKGEGGRERGREGERREEGGREKKIEGGNAINISNNNKSPGLRWGLGVFPRPLAMNSRVLIMLPL